MAVHTFSEHCIGTLQYEAIPTASYEISLIWKHLKERNLADLDRAKPAFMKRVLSVHANSRNRMFYLLKGTTLFVEDLRITLISRKRRHWRPSPRNRQRWKIKCGNPHVDLTATPWLNFLSINFKCAEIVHFMRRLMHVFANSVIRCLGCTTTLCTQSVIWKG